MKTSLRKIFIAPMLSLVMLTVLTPKINADIFEEEVIVFCTVKAITTSGDIIKVIGTYQDCKPAFNIWCSPEKCEAISVPEQ